MWLVGTVQNGRHKSNQLDIVSYLIKLHAHVHHNTLIDHTPQESVAGHDESHKVSPSCLFHL